MEGVSVGNNSAAGRAAGVGRGASTNEENEGNDCAHSSNEIGGGHSGLASSSFSEEAHGHPLRRSSRGNVPRYSSDPMLECSDDDDDDSDEDYTDGKDKDPTNGNIEKEEEDSVEEEDAVKEEDSLDKQSVATLRQKCKALGLKVGGTKADIINRIRNHDDDNDDGDKKPSAKKSRDDGTDDGNKKPRTSRPKQYSATPEGEPLWSNSRNTRLETEEYLRRSRTIKENPHLEGCNAPLAQWEEAFPGEGEMMQRWYKLNTRVLVTSEDDFHLDVLIYYDYSGRELGEMCQQFSDYCLDRVGNARISFPTRYSIAMEAVYHHGNFKMYTFLRALDYVITDASRSHENQNFIRARRLQEILENNYSLTTSTKSDERDIIQEEDYEVSYNSLFLEFAGVPPPPKLRVYPNVNKVCEAITAAVKETYAPESKASQLLVALQRGLCEKVKSTPELFKSLTTNQRNDMYSYRAFTELLARDGKDCDKCTTVQSVGTAEAAGDAFYQPIHNMSIDHNGLMAVWLKHLYQGKSPSASSWDDLMAQYALSQVFDWMAEWGNNNDEMMNWDQFNQDLSPLTRVNAHNGINGKCSLEMPCMSHHLCKDCSKGTRHLAGAALPGEVSSHAMRTINHKITNKLKMDVSNGKSALSNYCFTYLELPGVSFHHTSALSPVSVMEASKCRELMLDMKKEVSVSKLRHTASSQRRDEDVAAAAREVAVTAVVWENDHRSLHKIDNIDIGERPYNVANDVMVVNADEQREFTELFDIITEESDSTSTTGLTVTVRIVSGRAISIQQRLRLNRGLMCLLQKLKNVCRYSHRWMLNWTKEFVDRWLVYQQRDRFFEIIVWLSRRNGKLQEDNIIKHPSPNFVFKDDWLCPMDVYWRKRRV